ncbi:MAG: oxygen-independent coproporphyrinogen III oxidase [Bacteroidales bacterium]|nr:oxygen-independent coproporphyrinogen III oxidase [Bacteroidales bacterium]
MDKIKSILLKYNSAGPRYTSYPPANFFTESVNNDNYIESLIKSNNEGDSKLSLYFHIPFCSQLCFFCGCTTQKMRSDDFVSKYIDAIIKELQSVSEFVNSNRKVTQIHFGGGTPNAIDFSHLRKIVEKAKELFVFASDAEIAIECNPAYLDEERVEQLIEIGFNRFSLGIQDFNENVLKAVNREPSLLNVEELVNIIRKDGRASVNLDFIYGLPLQTVESFLENIKRSIIIKPDRLVTFSYAHVPWVKKAQQVLEETGLPSSDMKIEMLTKGYQLLLENGYKSIGMDHYALPTDDLCLAKEQRSLHRNFQGYCTKRSTGQVLAFGASGISQLHRAYIQNIKNVTKYIDSVKETGFAIERGYLLADNEIIIRECINTLMCNKYLSLQEKASELNVSVSELKEIINFSADSFSEFINDGLVKIEDDCIEVSENGAFVIRNMAMLIDPMLKTGDNMYSKTI